MSDDFQELQRLLRLKRYERPPQGYFDEFLREFQSRQRRELLHRSAHSIFFERVGTYFSGISHVGRSAWVVGGIGAYAAVMLGMVLLPGARDPNSGDMANASADPSGSTDGTLWDDNLTLPGGVEEAPFSPGSAFDPYAPDSPPPPTSRQRAPSPLRGGILPASDEAIIFREL